MLKGHKFISIIPVDDPISKAAAKTKSLKMKKSKNTRKSM